MVDMEGLGLVDLVGQGDKTGQRQQYTGKQQYQPPRIVPKPAPQAAASLRESAGASCISGFNVVVDQCNKVLGDVLASQRHLLLAVDKHRRGRSLAGTWQ